MTLAADQPWALRKTAVVTLIFVAIALVAGLVVWLRIVLLLLFAAIVVGTAVRPLCTFLSRRLGISGTTSTLWVYLVLAGVIIAAGAWGVPKIYEQGLALVASLPQWLEQARDTLISSSSRMLRTVGQWLPAEISSISFLSVAQDEGGGALFATQILLQIALGILVVGMLAFYWTINEELTIRSLLNFAPEHERESYRELVDTLLLKLGAYIRGQAILCAIVFVFSLIAYWVIGLPYVFTLALVAGLLEAIPIFGPTLGAVPAIIVGLSMGPQTGALVLGAAVVIQLLENYVFVPKVMDRSVGIGAVVVLLSIVAFGALLGPLGALLAIPLAAIVQTLFERLVLHRDFKEEASPARDFTGVVRYQVQDLIHDLQGQQRQKTSPSDELSAHAFDEMERLAVALDELAAREPPTASDERAEPATSVPVSQQ